MSNQIILRRTVGLNFLIFQYNEVSGSFLSKITKLRLTVIC